ncbi:hypothetical protein HNY73_019318 [Argiope bruennichi]|uniref:Uncharacterized protein n=1 Tax=Argiope bruennichi TaxID=94029 RepID=A0A8T0EJZ3_ARGBR|nr:hypothetical protein HNY73_019318 [Argiope bruennichi]
MNRPHIPSVITQWCRGVTRQLIAAFGREPAPKMLLCFSLHDQLSNHRDLSQRWSSNKGLEDATSAEWMSEIRESALSIPKKVSRIIARIIMTDSLATYISGSGKPPEI